MEDHDERDDEWDRDRGAEQQEEEYQQWLNSPDGVGYNLSYDGESAETRAHIIYTLLKLPRRVRNFALEHCRFISVGGPISGITLPGKIAIHPRTNRTRNMWLIVLDDNEAADEIDSTIAHEIAHAWRGDDRYENSGDRKVTTEDCEVKTAEQAREWGFQGRGADPDFQRSRFREYADIKSQIKKAQE